MNEAWISLLQLKADSDDVRFASPADEARAAVDGSVVCALADVALVEIKGVDAPAFLHAQLTNAVEDMISGETRLAAYCSPKGRMLTLLRVIRTETGFLVLIPAAIRDGFVKRLRTFVLRSKVAIADLSGERCVLGVAGAAAVEALERQLGRLPADSETRAAGEVLLLRAPGPTPRYLVAGSRAAIQQLWDALSTQLTPVGPAAWQLLDIRAGLPTVLPGTQESFVPQMANLDLLGGLSYQKGCYPGQEIVARMHYLGTLKRRMYRVHFAADALPEPGTEIRDSDGKRVGELVVAALAPEGYEGLVVLIIEQADQPGLKLGDAEIEVSPPPYSF